MPEPPSRWLKALAYSHDNDGAPKTRHVITRPTDQTDAMIAEALLYSARARCLVVVYEIDNETDERSPISVAYCGMSI